MTDSRARKRHLALHGQQPAPESEDEGLTEVEQLADAEAQASREALELAGQPTTTDAEPSILDPE